MADDRFDVVFLDAGGVLVSPLPQRVAAALAEVDVVVDPDHLLAAHYHGMLAVDLARSDAEYFGDYYGGYLGHLGFDQPDQVAAAAAVLDREWAAGGLWIDPVPGAVEGLAHLADLGIPVVIVSNADGSIRSLLEASGLCQVGDGAGLKVAGIIDSGVVGVAKPDPRIFELALEVVGCEAHRAVHIGDAFHYDVGGARAAGVHPVLVDPFDIRSDVDCDRIPSLAAIDRVLSAS